MESKDCGLKLLHSTGQGDDTFVSGRQSDWLDSMFGSEDVSAEIDDYDEINMGNEKHVVYKLSPSIPRVGTSIPTGLPRHTDRL